jgi:hypothetical protein
MIGPVISHLIPSSFVLLIHCFSGESNRRMRFGPHFESRYLRLRKPSERFLWVIDLSPADAAFGGFWLFPIGRPDNRISMGIYARMGENYHSRIMGTAFQPCLLLTRVAWMRRVLISVVRLFLWRKERENGRDHATFGRFLKHWCQVDLFEQIVLNFTPSHRPCIPLVEEIDHPTRGQCLITEVCPSF